VSEKKESREISGEVEGWSQEPREFGKNNMGSRGFKIEGEWHNIVGKVDELKELDTKFPNGTFVKFNEEKNTKGYWDIKGEIETIKKEEAYKDKPKSEAKPSLPTHGLMSTERENDIKLQLCLKVAATEMQIAYSYGEQEGLIDVDTLRKRLLAEAKTIYLGLKQIKTEMKEAGEW